MTTRVVYETPFQIVGGKETTKRLHHLNSLLLTRAAELAKRTETGARIFLDKRQRQSFLECPAERIAELAELPILWFEPSPLSMATTIAIRPATDPIDLEVARRLIRVASDMLHLVPYNKFGTSFILGLQIAEARQWDTLLTDDLADLIISKGAIEWKLRFPEVPSLQDFKTWDDMSLLKLLTQFSMQAAQRVVPHIFER